MFTTVQGGSYVSPAGVKSESMRREKLWQQFQQQERARNASMDLPHDSQQRSPKSRKRADSHQPSLLIPRSRRSVDAAQEHWYPVAITADTKSSYDHERPRRASVVEYGSRLSAQVSPTQPNEIRRISGNFNAPTEVELEREKEHRRILNSVEKLRSKVKGWVRQ